MRGYPPLRTIRRAASTEARKRQRAIGEGSGTKHTLTFLTNSLTGTAKIKSCKITPKNPAQDEKCAVPKIQELKYSTNEPNQGQGTDRNNQVN
ncbi:Hypothetical protein SMAX5B_005421 [Scophthalmus maximus]|uniref:Uncharacterized protein n=1 Tax=Scophthalmus maximus TaxID=52904 RepID=A0A2U9B1W7_SCOMX|nr:Hypothetical protein SMAX5B_005421 [Scophthalmus maximus]